MPPFARAQASAFASASERSAHASASAKPAMSMRSAVSAGSSERAFRMGVAQPCVARALMMRRCARTSLSPQ